MPIAGEGAMAVVSGASCSIRRRRETPGLSHLRMEHRCLLAIEAE